jgi:hypothetical protein
MLDEMVVVVWWAARAVAHRVPARFRGQGGERGEGVISTAIAVLIVAFLGAAAYVIFNNVLNTAGDNACDNVGNIGGAGNGCQTN